MKSKVRVFEKADSDINFKTKEKNTFLLRLYAIPFVMFFIFLILIVRLFQLTIVKGSYYRMISDQNRIREIALEAPRGTIKDRKGFTLVYSVPQGNQMKRIYNEPLALAPLVGYRQLASENDIKNDLCDRKINKGEKIGVSGIESVFECALRGTPGKKLIQIDSQGKFTKTLSLQPPIEGATVTLSIDLELQKKAYELMKDKKGAVIVIKPQTGEILALVSTPSFDPTQFENENNAVIKDYLKDPDQPLFNRATKAVYPPGSVFKTVLATGALTEHVIDTDFTVTDTGQIQAGPSTFGNWYFLEYGKTEGNVNIVKGIKRSNDIFFYRVGEKMGEDMIKKWANKFGYGKSTGIILGDSDGLVPSPFWKKAILKEDWYLGDTFNLSIGQGYLQVTPLQVAMSTLSLANGGNLCKAHLLKDQKPDCTSLGISKQTLDTIREGMKEACAPGGTGYPLFNFTVTTKSGPQPIAVACKTGTAELHGNQTNPHAWFTSYAPADKPEISITVMVENAGQGSDVAAPIARDLYTAYFERQN